MESGELVFWIFIVVIVAIFVLIFCLLSNEKKNRQKRSKSIKQYVHLSGSCRVKRNRLYKKDMVEALENGEIKFEIAMNSADKFNVLKWVRSFIKFINKPIAMQLLELEGRRKYE